MALLMKPATLVWLFLMAATCVTTWGLSKDRSPPESRPCRSS
ncbi:MAG: hypothetical protein Q8M37_03080 [Nevskia sp.]|nr:hypothetical protein [Nevskia sp.]